MPTALQFRLIHLAARQAGLDDAAYRMVLRNVGGMESSKQLDQVGFEDCLALFEERGWRDPGRAPDHWRSVVARRGSFCGSRVEHKIAELTARQKYALPGLCRRISNERTERVDKLSPHEGYQLIELLKEVIAREGTDTEPAAAAGGVPGPREASPPACEALPLLASL